MLEQRNGEVRGPGGARKSYLRRRWLAIKGPGLPFSSRRLWLLSAALYQRRRFLLAKWVKYVNSAIYHNSLPAEVSVSPDVKLGHQAVGTILHPKVVIGRGVKINHNVTIAVRPTQGPNQVVIEDGVTIGANAVIITPRNRTLRIGRDARIGAGAVVTRDVPADFVAVSPPAEVRPRTRLRDAGQPAEADAAAADDADVDAAADADIEAAADAD